MVIVYSTGCVNCKSLIAELDRNGIKYSIESDVGKMLAMGFTEVPVVDIDGHIMNKAEAIRWIRERSAR